MVKYTMDGPLRDRVMKLIEEKDRIESEIRQNTAVLETNNVGMNDPLVDADGFPRHDIDVYRVRHARHRIICLQNDHKDVMRRIERGLGEVHSEFRSQPNGNGASSSSNDHMVYSNGHTANGQATSNGLAAVSSASVIEDLTQAFARIAFVDSGSPADIAGLCQDDEVLQFGSVNQDNFRDMSQIQDIVAHSVGQTIPVKVRRRNSVFNLNVTPRPWAHPGLLGCQIVRRS